MGAPAEILEEIFTVIEGGQSIGQAAEIIQFPSDSGTQTFTAVQKTYQSTNGVGLNYWVAAVAQGTAAISAGALMVTVALPEFMALAVPCLGIAVGTAWYNIDPEGWTNLANQLMEAGWTIKQKVVGFMTEAGTIAFPPEEINILKDELVRLGAFEHGAQYPNYQPAPEEGIVVESNITVREMINYALSKISNMIVVDSIAKNQLANILLQYNDYASLVYMNPYPGYSTPSYGAIAQLNPVTDVMKSSRVTPSYVISMGRQLQADGFTHIIDFSISQSPSYMAQFDEYFLGSYKVNDIYHASSLNGTIINNENLQDYAKYPNEYDDIEEFYPTWIPWEFPVIPGWSIPKVYPVQYPELLPEIEPYQDPAQNPDADPDAEAEKGVDALEDPETDPAVDPEAGKDVAEDEDVGDEDEDIPGDIETDTPNPIEPDPPEPVTPIIPVPSFPDSVGSNKLFTVYNPNASQLGQLGGYLWDADLIDQLKRIWQNPLDGIISLSQVYCTPTTGSPQNIILGFLNSGISAKVVTSQFKEIDCGTVTVPELKNNATDYNPYTGLHLYLPFIGITELDVNDFMGGTIGVKYKVDVYTGTCLAEVRMIRTKDVPNGGIVYTFSGNCSQQLPLTSGDARGLFSALLSGVGVALGIASGGATAAVAAGGAAAKVHELSSQAAIANEGSGLVSREMLHVSRSGNLSANAGIMGQKKPYIIITRQNPYNANGYNRMYGYPCNKTVFLKNCSGYTRVKAGRLRNLATQDEKNEILQYLHTGVIM